MIRQVQQVVEYGAVNDELSLSAGLDESGKGQFLQMKRQGIRVDAQGLTESTGG